MQEGSFVASLLPLVVLFAIFYFLVIRPQQKQAKNHIAMVESLQKGDNIITYGGIICEVYKTEDSFIKVKLNEDTIVKISRDYVARKADA